MTAFLFSGKGAWLGKGAIAGGGFSQSDTLARRHKFWYLKSFLTYSEVQLSKQVLLERRWICIKDLNSPFCEHTHFSF